MEAFLSCPRLRRTVPGLCAGAETTGGVAVDVMPLVEQGRLIVGAGACGATTAYFLSGKGLKTGLLDQGRGGREASWASAGMIEPRFSPPRDPWFPQATTTSRRLYDRLAVQLPEQPQSRFGYGGENALMYRMTPEVLAALDPVKLTGAIASNYLEHLAICARLFYVDGHVQRYFGTANLLRTLHPQTRQSDKSYM